MAQLVLDPISPTIIHEIEDRARRAGTSVQAEALRLLEDALARDMAPRVHDAASNGDTAGLAERQMEIAAQYPEEYVVMRGERMLLHTPDKDDAFACQEDALEHAGAGEAEVIVVPPDARRRLPKPIVRGRSLAGGRRS